MVISPAEDVKTMADLEANPHSLVEQARATGRAVVIAEAGKSSVVLLTAERYEWLVHLINFSRLVNEAEAEVRAGKVRPVEEFIKELEDEGKLPRRNRRARRS